jgi:hypothetical protein
MRLVDFRSFCAGNKQIMPSGGFVAEFKKRDIREGERNEFTGSYTFSGNAGMDVYAGKYGFNLAARNPIAQHLSEGGLKINPTLSAGISRVF